MTIDKLIKMQNALNLTYQEVADQVGITKEYYWMIVNGKRTLSYSLAVKIAKAFKSSPDEIFLESELTTSKQNEKNYPTQEVG